MTDGPTRYPSFGRCIYCGRSDVPLSDEHVLPYSLFGVHVIERASCSKCATITGRFEQDVARGLWGDFRSSYGAPSRRKGSRPTNVVVEGPGKTSVEVPLSEYPAPGVFYQMPRAGFLSGIPATIDLTHSWKVVTLHDHERLVEFERKFGFAARASFRHVPQSFGRMLAKIGYGQILTGLHPDEFEPLCVPYILGTKTNMSHLVGGSLTTRAPEPVAYRMKSGAFGNASKIYLIAEIRLWAHLGAPDYHVVVGVVEGATQVESILAKMKAMGGTEVRRANDEPLRLDKPWTPRQWPL